MDQAGEVEPRSGKGYQLTEDIALEEICLRLSFDSTISSLPSLLPLSSLDSESDRLFCDPLAAYCLSEEAKDQNHLQLLTPRVGWKLHLSDPDSSKGEPQMTIPVCLPMCLLPFQPRVHVMCVCVCVCVRVSIHLKALCLPILELLPSPSVSLSESANPSTF